MKTILDYAIKKFLKREIVMRKNLLNKNCSLLYWKIQFQIIEIELEKIKGSKNQIIFMQQLNLCNSNRFQRFEIHGFPNYKSIVFRV